MWHNFYWLLLIASSALALYDKKGNVIELTPSNFDKLVIKGDEVWVVEFYAPWCGHCKNLAADYKKLANALKGVIKVGAVNTDKHKELGTRFGVSGFPTIKIFGENKNKPEEYNGNRTPQGIASAALNAVKTKVKHLLDSNQGGDSGKSSEDPQKSVIQLTDSNFDKLVLQSDDMWLVEFYAPWCGHCKNLAPHFADAAKQLKGKVKLGAIDATVHTVKANKYQVQGYPTLKYFPPGPKSTANVEEYDGGRTGNDIVSWALEKLAENIPAPEVLEVTSQDTFKKNCEEKPLCVVSVLPNILDCQSACRNAYIKILSQLAEKFKKKSWGWIWSEAGVQPDLEKSLDIGGFGYPAMAVINSKRMKYSILRGAFSSDGIFEFLRDLSYGKGNTSPLASNIAPVIVGTEPWDGKDRELPPIDDVDLSDVELDGKDEL